MRLRWPRLSATPRPPPPPLLGAPRLLLLSPPALPSSEAVRWETRGLRKVCSEPGVGPAGCCGCCAASMGGLEAGCHSRSTSRHVLLVGRRSRRSMLCCLPYLLMLSACGGSAGTGKHGSARMQRWPAAVPERQLLPAAAPSAPAHPLTPLQLQETPAVLPPRGLLKGTYSAWHLVGSLPSPRQGCSQVVRCSQLACALDPPASAAPHGCRRYRSGLLPTNAWPSQPAGHSLLLLRTTPCDPTGSSRPRPRQVAPGALLNAHCLPVSQMLPLLGLWLNDRCVPRSKAALLPCKVLPLGGPWQLQRSTNLSSCLAR